MGGLFPHVPHHDPRTLTVILGLMYILFGKLFHLFQRRPISVCSCTARRATWSAATLQRVRSPFASVVMQMGDLKDVLPQVGFDYDLPRRKLAGRLACRRAWSCSRRRAFGVRR